MLFKIRVEARMIYRLPVLSKKGYEFRINQDMWEDEFIRTSPFFIDEREK